MSEMLMDMSKRVRGGYACWGHGGRWCWSEDLTPTLTSCVTRCWLFNLSSVSSSLEKGSSAYLVGLLRGFWGVMNVLGLT